MLGGYFADFAHEVVKYRKMAEGEHDTEIIISNNITAENQTLQKHNRTFFQSKCCVCLSSILIILSVLLLTLVVLCYPSLFPKNLNRSCIPLQKIETVVISSENTSFNTCSNNETCHALKDSIEQSHDGLKYNFVIGQHGELYIGAGFKCQQRTEGNVLYVKLLTSENLSGETHNKHSKMCFRLHELIQHGISCGLISHNFKTQDNAKICSSEVSGHNRSHHVHDPQHHFKLIHGNIRWTVCGNSSLPVMHRVVTPENFQISSCQPLDMVEHIALDVYNTSPFNCSDDISCLHLYEKHDGLEYNFIVGFEHVYIGLGFNCKAESTDGKTLRIKLLVQHGEDVNLRSKTRLKQIIWEGEACGKISKDYFISKKIICESPKKDNCLDKLLIQEIYAINIDTGFESEYHNVSFEHGKGIVAHKLRYKFCHENRKNGTSISAHDSVKADLSTKMNTSLSTSTSQSTTVSSSTTTSPRTTTLSSTSTSPRTTTLSSTSTSPRTTTLSSISTSPRTTTLSSTSTSPRTTTLSSTSTSPRTTTSLSTTESSELYEEETEEFYKSYHSEPFILHDPRQDYIDHYDDYPIDLY